MPKSFQLIFRTDKEESLLLDFEELKIKKKRENKEKKIDEKLTVTLLIFKAMRYYIKKELNRLEK